MRPGVKKEARAQFTQSAPVFSHGPPVLSPSVMEPTSYYDEEVMGSPRQEHFYNPDGQPKPNRRYSQTNDFDLRLQFQNKKNESSNGKKGLFGFLGSNKKKNDPYPNYSYLNDVGQSRIDPMNNQIAAEKNDQKKKKKSMFSCLFPFGKKEDDTTNLLNIEDVRALQGQVAIQQQKYKVEENQREDSFKMFQQQNQNYAQNNNGMSSVQFPEEPKVQNNGISPKPYNPIQDPNMEFNSFMTHQGKPQLVPKQQPNQRTQMREENTRSMKPPEIGESVEFNSFRTYENGTMRTYESGTMRSEPPAPPPVVPRKGPSNIVPNPGQFTRDVQFSFVGTSPLPEVPTLQNIAPIKNKKPEQGKLKNTGDKSGSHVTLNASAPDFDVLMSPRKKQQTLQKPRMSDNDMLSLLASPSTLKRKKKNISSNVSSEGVSSGKNYSDSDMMDILMSPTTKRRNGASSFTSLDTEQANLLAPANKSFNGSSSRRNL